MKHLMLDLESVGNKSFAAIISIAAVQFDLETGKTGKEFHIHVDLQSCVNAGLNIESGTFLWWLNQNTYSIRYVLDGQKNSYPLHHALSNFRDFLNDVKPEHIWGNGVRFDLGLLINAYTACGEDFPWHQNIERDVRTLVSFAPEVKENMPFEGVKHNPIDDCKHQIKYCNHTWHRIMRTTSVNFYTIPQLVKQFPNDADLGAYIRATVNPQ